LALAERRRDAGQEDLANFVFSRNEKHLKELVKKTWAMHTTQSKIDHAKYLKGRNFGGKKIWRIW